MSFFGGHLERIVFERKEVPRHLFKVKCKEGIRNRRVTVSSTAVKGEFPLGSQQHKNSKLIIIVGWRHKHHFPEYTFGGCMEVDHSFAQVETNRDPR